MKNSTNRSSPRLALLLCVLALGAVSVALVTWWPRAPQSKAPPPPAANDTPGPRLAAHVAAAPPALPAPVAPEPLPQPAVARPQETICTQEGCRGPEASREKTRRFLEQHPGRFADDQIAILTAYTLDGLEQAVRDAEARFLQATNESRERDTRYYQRVLNLVSQLAPQPPPMPPHEKVLYDRYAEALRKAGPSLAAMAPEAAEHERSRIKEDIFRK